MDKKQASKMRNHKLILIKNKMDYARSRMGDVYMRNQKEIDERVKEIVSGICLIKPVHYKNMMRTFTNVVESLFYKRPANSVVQFMNDVAGYPSEVIYESIMSYSMFLIEHGKKNKKNNIRYFHGFLKKSFFNYQEKKNEKTVLIRDSDSMGVSDDF